MKSVALIVNGERREATVEPRTSLADLLRNTFVLTGTHLGCEHGVCGACTVIIDGKPSRSCITYAVQTEGCDVRTIEGFDDDAVMERLRGEFTRQHALQCGYCTPGMLITARDIVTRLGDPGETRVREELAGNLCRCTGYAGIVAAVRAVGAERPAIAEAADAPATETASLPQIAAAALAPQTGAAEAPRLHGAEIIQQQFTIDAPIDVVWSFFKDLSAVTGCIPGAALVSSDDRNFEARISVKFGPIRASMTGIGTYRFDDVAQTGELTGSGKDRFTGSVANGMLGFSVHPASPQTTEVRTEIAFKLSGLLGQFSRGPLVREFARSTMNQFAANVAAALHQGTAGQAPRAAAPEPGFFARLFRRILGR